MTELILIRHGETAWNAQRRLQGHLDIPLNVQGEKQAAALGQRLLSEAVDTIVSSDLQRALQTAQAVALPRGLPVIVDAGLRERCFGGFEGLLYDEIHEKFPEAHAAWKSREPDARFPDGRHTAETLNEFFSRVAAAINRVVHPRIGQKIAIVTHGGVLDCIYRMANKLEIAQPRDFDVLNASINRVLWSDEGMQVIQWADIDHLSADVLDEIER